jgi:hypothetical protein
VKLVTFNRVMRGVGNPALLPDDVAQGCFERGELAKPPEPDPREPKTAAAAVAATSKRRVGRLLGQTFLTK